MDFADPLPTLEGRRLRLRQLDGDDVPALYRLLSDERVMHYWSHAALRTLDDAAWYLRDVDAGRASGSHYQWGIVLRDSDEVIGSTTLFSFDRKQRRAMVGYVLAFAHWQLGYASEALRLVAECAFGPMQLESIEADIDEGNDASCHVAEKLGFVDTGERCARSYPGGRTAQGKIYRLQRDSLACDEADAKFS